jgi:hypothetical protein
MYISLPFHTSRVLYIAFISFVIILGSSIRVTAKECKVPLDIVSDRPNPNSVPTVVSIGIYIIDIKKIDDVSQNFFVDFAITLKWHDSRLSAKALGRSLVGCNLQINDIWNPRVLFINQEKLDKLFEVVKIDDSGNVLHIRQFIGSLSSNLDLREFPYDIQELKISLVSAGYTPDEVMFNVDSFSTGQLEKFSIAEWLVEPGEASITTQYIAVQRRSFPRFDFKFLAQRYVGFYIWKVFLPLTLIVFMASCVFWIDPAQVGPQIGVSTASVFTLIAFQFSLGYLLPRVSYLTRADTFLMGSTLLVFLAMGEAVTTSRLVKSGKHELSRKIDRWARVIYPVVFIFHSVFSLWV